MPEEAFFAVALAVALCVAFNFISGFQDPVSSIATSIATRALAIPAALLLLASMGFIGALVSQKVAYTVATGVAAPGLVGPYVIIAATSAAIGWNLFMWRLSLPSSASHALISGLFGAAMTKAITTGGGYERINWPMLGKIFVALLTSPFFGFIAGFLIFKLAVRVVCALGAPVSTQLWNRFFARLQPLSAAAMSFSIGVNDAQKTMGLATLALLHGGMIGKFETPLWVTVICGAAMSLGALAGGVRIIKTVAVKITEMKPVHGFCAEMGSATVVLGASMIGMPISTTHVAISSVVGVGSSKSTGAVQINVVKKIIYAWITTIPASILMAAFFYLFASMAGPRVFALALALGSLAAGALSGGAGKRVSRWLRAQPRP